MYPLTPAARPSWGSGGVSSDTLTWLAERGDVQNAVSMYIALAGGRSNGAGEERVKGLVGETVLEHWWLSYVEMLQRLELFTQANEVRLSNTVGAGCPLPSGSRRSLWPDQISSGHITGPEIQDRLCAAISDHDFISLFEIPKWPFQGPQSFQDPPPSLSLPMGPAA